MGHGNRWEAVGGDDAGNAFQRALPRIVQFGTALRGPERRFAWPGNADGQEQNVVAAPSGIVLHEEPLVFWAITLPKPSGGGSALMTAYPSPGEGIKRRMIVREVEEHCLGLEGWVHAETESGVPITFFATDYFANPEAYAEGSAVDVSLSGLAYAIEAATPREIVIDDPEAIRGYREAGMAVPEGEPIRVSTQGAAMLFAMEDWEPFDYQFQGPLKAHKRFEHEGYPLHGLLVTVARGDDDDIDLPVLAGGRVLDGEIPPLGADIAGSLCVMGRRIDLPS